MRAEDELGRELTEHWHKQIWRPFMSAVREYALLEDGDHIAVCISGGKDSMLLALCMREYVRRSPMHIELHYLCMDPGYLPEVRTQIDANAQTLSIPLEFFNTDIFERVSQMDCKPCFMCSKMRRGCLYRRAEALGCNKIALGHHFDDVVETLLMSMLYSGQLRGMRPMVVSENVPDMRLIRPLYKVREADIIEWRDAHALSFLPCSCSFAREGADSKRREVKQLLRTLSGKDPHIPERIFRSAHNAMLDSLNGWKLNGTMHSFMERDTDGVTNI